jgi:hypothetical protein
MNRQPRDFSSARIRRQAFDTRNTGASATVTACLVTLPPTTLVRVPIQA